MSFKVFAILMVFGMSFGDLLASETDSHLQPTASDFDTLPPYGKKFAEICERVLFPTSSWKLRYFQIIGDPPYDTGLTIYQKADGSHWLMVRQARPEIKGIVIDAFAGRANLKRALALVRVESSNRRIPSEVAVETHRLWLALLRGTRSRSKVDETHYIHPTTVILSVKDGSGGRLDGKYPPDAAKLRTFMSVESIVDSLVKSCDTRGGDRLRLLHRAAKEARQLRARIEAY